LTHTKQNRRAVASGSMRRVLGAAVGITALGLAAACSGGNSSYSVACDAIVEAVPALFIPSPGATGVPVTLGSIIVGSPADGSFSLHVENETTLSMGPVSAVPSPLPSGVPTFNPPSFFHAVALPKLAPATTYAVDYQAKLGPPPCGSGESSGTLGSFVTESVTSQGLRGTVFGAR
jgi:hypothetical protein